MVQLTAGGLLPILDGSNLTNLNAGALATGTIDNNRLSNTVTIQGNAFNGNSQLVQTTAGGALPALSGVNLTSLNGSAIASGIVGVSYGGTGAANASGARINLGAAASGANSDITSLTGLTAITPSASLTIGSTGQNLTIQGSATTSLRASDSGFTSQLIFAIPTGNATITLPNTTGTVCLSTGNCLGGGSGGANTSLSNLTSVSLNTSLIPGSNSIDIGSLSAPFKDLYIGNTSGNGVKFTAAPTANRTITIPDASGTLCLSTGNCAGAGGGITGGGTQYYLPVFSNAANIVDSIIAQNAGATVVTVNGDISVTGSISGNGSGITNLSADNVASGTLSDSRLSTNVTIQGNQFNGNNQLVKTTAGGALPAVSGANLTNLNASAISSGTVGISYGGTGQTTFTTGDLLVGAAGNTTSKLGIGANNTCLISNGTNPVWGSCTAGGGGFTSLTLAGTTGTPQTITDLGTITIAAGTNISTSAGATGTVTIATVSNPTFSGLVTAGNGLTVSSGNFVVTSGTINNATISGGSLTGGSVSGGSLNGTTVNGVTTADIVLTTGSYADPSWITSLAKSKVGLGNVENTALSTWSGSANLVTLGTITTGTWTGSVIADGYIADNLTINNSGSVDWTALTSYPTACAAGTAITALGDTSTCTAFAPSTGSGNYVQIQGATPGVAQNGNFNIDGTAIAGSFSGNGANLSNLSGSNVSSGVVAINVGGTGATTAQNAINNISGLTTNGDILYSNGTNSTRLPRGNNGDCLLSSAATIFWGNCAGNGTTYFNLMGSSGVSQPINGGDTVTVAAGSNITTVAGATDTVTIAVTDTPTFAGLITGQAGLTVSSGGANITGNSNITGTLGSLTGLTSAGTIVFSGLGTNGFVKTSGSNGTLSVSTTVALTSDVSGTLSVSNGGTGGTTFTPNGILYGTGATALGITGAGVTGDCLVATTNGAPSWQNCAATVGTGGDLQSSYNTSTGGTTPEIKVDATRGAVDIQDADSSINGIIFAVRGSNASGLGTPFLSVSSDGTTTFKSNSNYGFEIQNSSGVGLFLTNNISSTVTIPGYNNLVVLGPELITNSDYSSAAWTSTGSWTLTSTDATHNVGTYDTLDTTQVTPTIGSIYVVHVDFVNNTNNGCIFIAFAGSAGSGNCGTNSYAEVQVKASATSTLSLTASDTFNGKITNVSIKAYPVSRTPALKVGDTAIQAGSGGSTYIGQDSGSKSFGFYNTGVGAGALMSQQTGTNNTALGYNALHVSESAYNTAVGSGALLSNTTGAWNTALGYYSLPANTTGNNNVSIGYSSSAQLQSGTNNTAVGGTALSGTTTGSYNTTLGYGSGSNNTTGSYNLFLGYMTGYLDTSTGFSTPNNLQYATAVGSGAIVQQSYSLVLGQVGTKVGIGTTIPMNQLSVAGWAVASDNNASASQSGTTVTGVGTSWNASMVGMQFVFSNGSNGIITAVTDATHLTLNTSQTVASTSWRIQKIGFQVTSSGGVYIQTSETNAFKVNTDNGVTFFGVDTGAGRVTIGQGGAGNLPGKLALYNSSNYNDITLVAGATSTSFTLTLPTSAGNANECLQNSGTAGVLQFGACGTSTSLQGAYTDSTGGTTPEILLDSTRGGVDIQDANTSINSNLLTVRASSGSGLGQALFNINSTGQTSLQNSIDSSLALQILNTTNGNLLSVGTSNNQVTLGASSALTFNDPMTSTPNGTMTNNATYVAGSYVRLTDGGAFSNSGQITYTDASTTNYDSNFQYYTTGGTDDVFWFSQATTTPTTPGAASGGYKISFNQAVPSGSGTVNLYYDTTLVTSATGFTPTSGVWHDVRVVLSGTRIKVYYDTSLILDYTDISRSLTGTKFGLAGYVGGYWTGSARVRNFTMNSTSSGVVGSVALNVYGSSKIQTSTNTTTAFQIQNANGVSVLNVDTTNGQLQLGSYNGGTNAVAGALVLNNATNANGLTIVAGATASNYTLTLPTSAGNASDCLKNTGTAGVLTFGGCGSATTLQGAYDAGSAGDQVVQYNNTNNSVIFRNPASSGTASSFALKVDQLNTGSGVTALVVNNAGTGNTLNLQNAGTSVLKVDNTGDLLAVGASTATTGTTEATARTNVTTVTLTAAGSFANNDVIFIDNAGQDYYTRIVSGGGTTTLTVSPAVSYDVSATVTKYSVQNIGATTTDYTTQSNRFFQGYFLGGVVTGSGSTTLSDGNLKSTNALQIQTATGVTVKNSADSTSAFSVQNAAGTSILKIDSTNKKIIAGAVTAPVVNNFSISDSYTTTPTGTLSGAASYVSGQYVALVTNCCSTGAVEYNPALESDFDASFQFNINSSYTGILLYAFNNSTPGQEGGTTGGYQVSFNQYDGQVKLIFNGSVLTSTAVSINDSTWHNAQVVKTGTNIKVYLDSVQKINYTDSARVFTGTKFGLDGYTNCCGGNKWVRNFVLNWTTTTPGTNPTLSIDTATGQTSFTSSTNSTNALQLQNSSGIAYFNGDSTNQRIGINTVSPNAPLEVSVSSTSSTFTNGFESGTIAPFTQTAAVQQWYNDATGANAHSGSRSARIDGTGAPAATLQLTKTLTTNGAVSFWMTMSPWVTLNFKIDGATQQTWSNSSLSYTQFTYQVGSGAHTFSWEVTSILSGRSVNIDDVTITSVSPSNVVGAFNGSIGVNTNTVANNFVLDANTGSSASTLWAGVASSSSTALRGGLLLHQYSNYGIQLATQNTSSVGNGQLVFDYRALNDGSVVKSNILTLRGDGNVGIGTATPNALLHVGTPSAGAYYNGFESGTFGDFSATGATPWTVANNSCYSGSFCAINSQAGASNLTLTKTLSSAGTISFWFSKDAWMNGSFKIDGVQQVGWGNGGISNTYYSYSVSAGTHTFTWESTASGGNSTSRVDDVTITNVAGSSVSAVFDGYVGIGTTNPTTGLDVRGSALFKNISDSTTAFQIQTSAGTAFFTADSTNSKVTVTNLVITASLTVNGHIISGNSSGTTTVAAGSAACSSPTVSIAGNDTAGVITVTTGTACAAGGTLATVSFANSYTSAPPVVITPQDSTSAALQTYATQGTATFVLGTNTTATATTTYKYNYLVVQ